VGVVWGGEPCYGARGRVAIAGGERVRDFETALGVGT